MAENKVPTKSERMTIRTSPALKRKLATASEQAKMSQAEIIERGIRMALKKMREEGVIK